ncbi:MAG: hypothetical protein IT284_02325 [Bacteroidetes bacterium]|nr:hypothetical protein [Bacteroidota bacterium]
MLKNFFLSLLILLSSASFAYAQDEEKKEEGKFFNNINNSIIEFFGKIEDWREKEVSVFHESLDKVDAKRQEQKENEVKPAIRVFTIAHIVLLSILLFVFSLQVAFYIVAGVIVISILRKILGFLFGLFRRGDFDNRF